MVDEVAALLDEPSPLPLLEFASSLIEATRPRAPFESRSREVVDNRQLFTSFVDSGFPEMATLAQAVAVLHPDEQLAARLRWDTALATGPRWLESIGRIEIEGAMTHQHVLNDGENIVVGWRWPNRTAATVVVYVDHNMGTVVKDAFVVDDDLASLKVLYRKLREPGMRIGDLAPADARARLDEALTNYGRAIDMPESDTWPQTRPLLEWLTGRLPTGGTGYVRPDWPEEARERLIDQFLVSPHSRVKGLSADAVAMVVGPLLRFGCDHGPGDPLRWSPVGVEIVLTDWYPRKVLGLPASVLPRLPDVLAGFVPFAHERSGIPADLTAETVAAVTHWRPVFDEIIAGISGRPGPVEVPPQPDLSMAELRFVLEHGQDFVDDQAYLEAVVTALEAAVIDLVGGPARYAELDDEPLGDIAFDWTGIPEDIRPQTEATLADLDRWAVDLFDPEVRTVARAVLAAVVITDPATFNRSSNTAGLAAAILGYLIRRLTDRLSWSEREDIPWRVHSFAALADATGVRAQSIGSRSKTVAKVVGRSGLDWTPILHSTQRREAMASKARITEWRTRQP